MTLSPTSDPSFPNGATAVVLNVTVTDATENSHVTVWPGNQNHPASSNVNVARRGTSANLVTVPIGSTSGQAPRSTPDRRH